MQNSNNLPNLFVSLSAHTDLSIYEQYEVIRYVPDIGVRIRISHIVSSSRPKLKKFDSHLLFFDLRLNDSKSEMLEMVKIVASLGASLISVNTLAGRVLKDVIVESEKFNIKVFANTVPLQNTDSYCNQYFGMNSLSAINFLVGKAREFGCHGYIIPGHLLKGSEDIRNKVGGITLCPSVRPLWYSVPRLSALQVERSDIVSVLTPREAKSYGADIVVCHAPIFQSDFNPAMAIEKIKEELASI
jgi:orotidine-5'-phosphate decarboxylase